MTRALLYQAQLLGVSIREQSQVTGSKRWIAWWYQSGDMEWDISLHILKDEGSPSNLVIRV